MLSLGQFFIHCHLCQRIKNSKKKINNNSEELSNYGICLPSGNDMTLKKIKVVSKIIKKILIEKN